MFNDPTDPEKKRLEKELSAARHNKERNRPRHLAPGEVPSDDMKDWQLRGRAWHWAVVARFIRWFYTTSERVLIKQIIRHVKRMTYHETNSFMEELSDQVSDVQAWREQEAERIMREARKRGQE